MGECEGPAAAAPQFLDEHLPLEMVAAFTGLGDHA